MYLGAWNEWVPEHGKSLWTALRTLTLLAPASARHRLGREAHRTAYRMPRRSRYKTRGTPLYGRLVVGTVQTEISFACSAMSVKTAAGRRRFRTNLLAGYERGASALRRQLVPRSVGRSERW